MSILLEELNERDRENILDAIDVITNQNVTWLAGWGLDVDSLQLALEMSGYKKGSIGRNEDIWYRNIISNSGGYIAELEAISPEGYKHTFVVRATDFGTEVIGVN